MRAGITLMETEPYIRVGGLIRFGVIGQSGISGPAPLSLPRAKKIRINHSTIMMADQTLDKRARCQCVLVS
jgi:hypothetical protein